MYVRVSVSQVDPSRIDEAARIMREEVVFAARQQPGFKGILVYADRRTGKGGTVTLWATENDLAASEASGYVRKALSKVASLFTSPPVLDSYELLIDERM